MYKFNLNNLCPRSMLERCSDLNSQCKSYYTLPSFFNSYQVQRQSRSHFPVYWIEDCFETFPFLGLGDARVFWILPWI